MKTKDEILAYLDLLYKGKEQLLIQLERQNGAIAAIENILSNEKSDIQQGNSTSSTGYNPAQA